MLFLFRGQNVVDLVLSFHAGQHTGFVLLGHFVDLRFGFRFIEAVAGNDVMHCAAFFQRRTFHLVALTFHDVTHLLFLCIRQVQVFKHHVVMHTRLALVMHHLAFGRCSGGRCGIRSERHAGSAQSQGRSNKQCS
ncbi:hypothetical protein D3C72_1897240 [compost metagenome]